ncbi:MAG: hypothetical protein HOO06_07320 [Bdellovibrionaceae bacterium]|nr:hypothetical protein [Pseudobdellovibrionaceae bacterium]
MKLLNLILLLLLCSQASAYVPNLDMILSRMSRNHGYGFYFVEQEVVFPNEPTPYIVKEHWTVENDNTVKLRVYGQNELEGQLQATFVYRGNKKYFLDYVGTKKVTTKNQDWLHPYFFFRDVKKIKNKLFTQNIIPASALEDKALNFNKKLEAGDFKQDYVKLARNGGKVSYFVGIPSVANNLKPGLWSIQDKFHLTKLRLKSGSELDAQNHGRYLRGLWLPKTHRIHFDDNFIQVNLRRVKGLSGSNSLKKKMKHTALDKTVQADITILPDIKLIQEFYKRFR